MACGALSGGIELNFRVTGMRIRPIEGRIEETGDRMQVAEFKLSEEAGLLIKEKYRDAEPVHIIINDQHVHRMIMPPDGLQFEHDIGDDTVAYIQLYDGMAVLSRSIISKAITNVTMGEILDAIINSRDDPNDVIQAWRWTDPALKDEMFSKAQAAFVDENRFTPVLEAPYVATEDTFGDMPGTLDAKDENTLDVLQRVLEEKSLSAWLEPNGTLMVGLDASVNEILTVIDSAQMPGLETYTVTEQTDNVAMVVARGTFISDTREGTWIKDQAGVALRGYGIAEIPDSSGRKVSVKSTVSTGDLETLEFVAHRQLIKERMSDIAGTIEFDGLNVDDPDKFARARRGTHVFVDGDVITECEGSPDRVIGGEYVVRDAVHRFNPREGWRIILDVGQIPTNVETNSYIYDPLSSTEYETAKQYQTAYTEAQTDGVVGDLFTD